MSASAVESVATVYADFGRRWAHGTSPLYEDWAIGIATDPDMTRRIAALEPRMRQPNIVLAAARWEGCPLAPWPQARSWFAANWHRVVATAAVRSTQTNEPNRCATLLPPLSRITGPVALLEVGTAAGLCLFPDRYSVEYATPSGPRRLDPIDGESAVTLACRLDADASLPPLMPDVVWRRGIDLSPVDAGDLDAVDWLANLVWPGPDHDARVARLRAAAAVVAQERPEIIAGDLLETVTDAAAAAPADATLVVFHSAVLLYLDAVGRERFAGIMAGMGAAIDRRVVWISNETAGTLARIDAQLPPGLDAHHRFVQTVDGAPVALAGQHGAVYETRPLAL